MNTLLKKWYWLLGGLLITMSACKFDHLYYSTEAYCPVRLNVNWSKTNINLNGATVYVYNADGTLYKEMPPYSNPNKLEMMLPAGHFNIVLHSNTKWEMPALCFVGVDNDTSLCVQAQQLTASKPHTSGHEELDNIASAHLFDLHITPAMIDYYPQKPELSELRQYKEYSVDAQHFLSQIEIQVHVTGLKYAAGAPQSELSGISAGYYLMRQEPCSEETTCMFLLNNRRVDALNTGDGYISKTIQSFGMCPGTKNRYTLTMKFKLIDGNPHTVELDVTRRLEQIAPLKYKIVVECQLPEVPSIGGDDGAFDTGVDEWQDIEVDIPM
ncbi:MAG: DUF5119 domain-containing protein [Marinifilaceae bacterium]